MTAFKDAWGFSKLDVYRECPAKFKFQFIDKIKSMTSSPGMERGGEIHEAFEMYLNGWATKLPEAMERWRDPLDAIKAANCVGEQALGFDKEWNKLIDWFHPKTWLRVKMDAYYVHPHTGLLHVVDFKTGQYRKPSTEQVELYAIAGHILKPDAPSVMAEFWFLDADEFYKHEYKPVERMAVRKKYEQQSEQLYTERQWEPTPSRVCRWCPYSRVKNGPCKY